MWILRCICGGGFFILFFASSGKCPQLALTGLLFCSWTTWQLLLPLYASASSMWVGTYGSSFVVVLLLYCQISSIDIRSKSHKDLIFSLTHSSSQLQGIRSSLEYEGQLILFLLSIWSSCGGFSALESGWVRSDKLKLIADKKTADGLIKEK